MTISFDHCNTELLQDLPLVRQRIKPPVTAEEQPQTVQANHQRAPLMRSDTDGQRHRAERRRDHHDNHHAKRDRQVLPNNCPRPAAQPMQPLGRLQKHLQKN